MLKIQFSISKLSFKL